MVINIASLAQEIAQHLFTDTTLYMVLKEMGKGASSEVGKKLINSVTGKTKALLEKLSPKIETEPAIIEAIKGLGQKPDDQRAQSVLESQLEKLLRDSPEWAKEVAQLWEETRPAIAKDTSVVINAGRDVTNSKIIIGDHNQVE